MTHTDSHADDEGMRNRRENLFLVVHVLDLLQSYHLADGHDLECKVVAGREVFG